MLLSIIIPCYNSEGFIATTLNSLISQDLSECEIIVVNDGSIDSTAQIVSTYAEKYNEIRLIDKQNEGVSVARNMGLKLAQGKFICFLDSDDDFTIGTLDFYRKVLKNNYDYELFSFGYTANRNGVIKKIYACSRIDDNLTPISFVQNFFIKNIQLHIGSFICSKTFLEVNKLFFTEGLVQGEDIEFILNILKYLPKSKYFYRQCFIYQLRDNSVTCNYSVYGREHLYFFELWRNIVQSNEFQTTQLREYANFWLQNLFISHIFTYLRYGKKDQYITDCLCMNYNILKQPCIPLKNINYFFLCIAKILPIKFLLGLLK